MISWDPLKFMVQDLDCFCEYCLNEEWEFCVNTAHTGWWQLETLMPLNGIATHMIINLDDVKVGQKLEFGYDGQSLNATLKLGNNFVAQKRHPFGLFKELIGSKLFKVYH
jgi:hypothetical protein